MDQIVKQAAVTKLKVIREIGLFLKKEIKKGGKEGVLEQVGLTRRESSEFQQVAAIEDYHWTYVLESFTQMKQVIREYERAKGLREMIESNKIKNPKEALKNYIINGKSVVMAEFDLKDEGIKHSADMTPAENDDDKEWSSDAEEPVKVTMKRTPADKQASEYVLFESNIKHIVSCLDTFSPMLDNVKSISREQYAGLLSSVKLLKESLANVIESIKEAKPKVTK